MPPHKGGGVVLSWAPVLNDDMGQSKRPSPVFWGSVGRRDTGKILGSNTGIRDDVRVRTIMKALLHDS